jgi:Kef-type K+ transport system membrane component KefB
VPHRSDALPGVASSANASTVGRRVRRAAVFAAFATLILPGAALASEGGGHEDPIAPVVLALAVILVLAKLGGDLAVRLRQPAVLGELVTGVVLGNANLLGVGVFEHFKADPTLDMLARLGVLVLLFEVGLESTVGQMLKVGLSSLLVAVIGVVCPMALGFGVSALLVPHGSMFVHLFTGATLAATSVGITARVLQDLGRSQSREARIILGAAVIDDVLGLVVLAVITGLIAAADQGHPISYGALGLILVKALAFLVGALAIGVRVAGPLLHVVSQLKARGVLLAMGLGFCFFLSWMASVIGLAPIVGAFAAGLILEAVHYRDFTDRGEHGLEELVRPIASFLTPIFFVIMGMRTNLRAFVDLRVLGLAGGLTVAAVIGKQACALGARGKGLDRLSIGIGMIPRGEVGLIFANIGAALTIHGEPVVDPREFSAIVVMVIATTMLTPPALKWSMARYARRMHVARS